MNLTRQQLDAIHAHASSVVDGTVTPAEFAELTAILDSSVEARRHYAKIMYLQVLLVRALRSQEAAVTVPAGDSEKVVPSPSKSVAVSSAPFARARRVAAPSSPDRWGIAAFLRKAARYLPGGEFTVGSLVVLVVVFALGGVILSQLSRSGKDRHELANYFPEDAVATMTRADGESRSAKRTPSRKSVRLGEPLKIEAGTAVLHLKRGATLTVQGPAEWTIDGDNQATLMRGRLVAKVPQQAIGFSIETPSSQIVDLGTEFGVAVDEQGQTETHVFQGTIEIKTGDADSQRIAQAPASRKLVAGESARIDAKGSVTSIVPFANNPEQFIKPPKAATSAAKNRSVAIESPDAYSKAVLKTAGLVSYWRLGDDGDQDAKDEVGATANQPLGRSPGKYLGLQFNNRGHSNKSSEDNDRAANFDGRSCIEIPSQPHLTGDWQGLTLTAWIKPNRLQSQENDVAVLVGKWASRISGDSYLLSYRNGLLYFAVGNGVVDQSSLISVGNTPLTFDNYHFVVGTWQKHTGSYRLYVDGEANLAQGNQKPPWQLTVNTETPLSLGGQSVTANRYFSGAIDEVCIFSRALKPEEISHLYETAMPIDKALKESNNQK